MKRFAVAGALLAAVAIFGLGGCQPKGAGSVDSARLTAADNDTDNWLSYGRTYDEQRFSPLTDVSTSNVGQLGLAWYYESRHRPRPGSHAARGRTA